MIQSHLPPHPTLSHQGRGLFGVDSFLNTQKKLTLLNSAKTLDDLRCPPGNRLEALSGEREGQWSIRINDQYRICFYWTGYGPAEVEIVDYHS